MTNILTKYLKSILIYLIPLFIITLGKHNTCIDESFLSNDINIEEKLNLICDQNKTLCLLIDVIKDSLNSIKTYSQTYEEKMDDITLKYQNVYSNDLTCLNVSSEIKDEGKEAINPGDEYIVSFSNCTSFMLGKLTYSDLQYNNFESKLFIDRIIISMGKNPLKGEVHLIYQYNEMINKTFDYNKDEEIFEGNVKIKMDNIMENVFHNYTYNLKSIIELDDYQLLSQLKYFGDIINRFSKEYSLLKPAFDGSKNKISYIGYNGFDYLTLINIKNNIYINNLTVSFEYALNYNITYNEGSFQIDYMNFTKSNKDGVYIGNMINKYAGFEEIVTKEENEEIWNTIKIDFYNKFKLYK